MAKMIVFASVLVALLVLAHASRFTITTTVVEDGNQQGQGQGQGREWGQGQGQQGQQPSERCVREFAPQSIRLRACQQFLLDPYERERNIRLQQRGQGQGQGQEQGQQQVTPGQERLVSECCEGLRNIEGSCRCDAVQSVVWDIGQMTQQQHEQDPRLKAGEVEQIRQAARSIPQLCNLAPQPCRSF